MATASDYMDKLRSRKAEVDEQLDRSKRAARAESAPLFVPNAAPGGPIGEPLLEGGEIGETTVGRAAAEDATPEHGRGPAAAGETKLHQPPLRPNNASGKNERKKRQRTGDYSSERTQP